MQTVGVPDDIIVIVQGIIIFFVAADRIIKTWIIKASKLGKKIKILKLSKAVKRHDLDSSYIYCSIYTFIL